MLKHLARDSVKMSYPRRHYNSQKKAKKQFQTIEEAEDYIKQRKLEGYTIYFCDICSMYHISHKNKGG
jgi:hypothetical protein